MNDQETANYQIHNLARRPIHTAMSTDRENQPSQNCVSQGQTPQGYQGGPQGDGSPHQTGSQADQATCSSHLVWARDGFPEYPVNTTGPSPIPMQNARMNLLYGVQRQQQAPQQFCQPPQYVDPRATYSVTSTATQTLDPQQGAHGGEPGGEPGGAGTGQAPAASGDPTGARKRRYES